MKFFVKNVNTTLRVVLTILNVLGFWDNPFAGYQKLLFNLYTACWFMYINGIFVLSEVGDLIQNFGDVTIITDTATLLLTMAALTVKMVLILTKRAVVKQMVDECNMVLEGQTKKKSKVIIMNCDKETRKFMYMFLMAALFTSCVWWINAKPYETPVRAWVPWDISTSPTYEITSAAQMIALMIAATCDVGIDFIMISLTAQCKCRLEILCLALETSCDDMVPTTNLLFSKDQEDIIKSRLFDCIREHQAILSCVRKLQNCFSIPILSQFAVSSTIMCMTLFQMAFKANNLFDAIGMFIYLSAVTMQVFFYCLYGDELLVQSLKVADASYQASWYYCSNQVRKLHLIIIMRAQHAAYISAGGLFDLSLVTFLAIVKSAYSFYTVLSHVQTK